uniref:Uncharacterized protein n=1 Tax=Cryptomonas curvata TaxID=233186 RepID=A0A7S0LZI9_9CRYP|mmetsp:Transcript_1758/g.3677  ORF Transcript_1758/g.3677 Transcript_1758/m.3677 type:complete len:109 (+) Transcript_1758:5-331(+)
MELLVVGAAVTSCIGAWFMATEVYDDGLKEKHQTESFNDYKFNVPARNVSLEKASDYVFWNTVDKQVPSTFDASMKTVKVGKAEKTQSFSGNYSHKLLSTRNQNRAVC